MICEAMVLLKRKLIIMKARFLNKQTHSHTASQTDSKTKLFFQSLICIRPANLLRKDAPVTISNESKFPDFNCV